MLIQVPVYSFRPFSFQRLSALLGVDDLVLVSSPLPARRPMPGSSIAGNTLSRCS